LKRKKNLS